MKQQLNLEKLFCLRASILLSNITPENIQKHPATHTHIHTLAPCICFCVISVIIQYLQPQLRISINIEPTIENLTFFLLITHVPRIPYWNECITLSVSTFLASNSASFFPLFMNTALRYLNSSISLNDVLLPCAWKIFLRNDHCLSLDNSSSHLCLTALDTVNPFSVCQRAPSGELSCIMSPANISQLISTILQQQKYVNPVYKNSEIKNVSIQVFFIMQQSICHVAQILQFKTTAKPAT